MILNKLFYIVFFALIVFSNSFLYNKLSSIHSNKRSLLFSSKKNKNIQITNKLLIDKALGFHHFHSNSSNNSLIPIWLYRQAGRHLPIYNQYKKKHNKNFLDLLKNPNDILQCTLQPIYFYYPFVDSAILFSDILVCLEPLGINLSMPGGKGIQVVNPVESTEDLKELLKRSEELGGDREKLKKHYNVIIEAIQSIQKELSDLYLDPSKVTKDLTNSQIGKKISLLGFTGAPYTLFYYLLGSTSKKNQLKPLSWLKSKDKEQAELSKKLLVSITHLVIELISLQIDSGCDGIHLFEAMGSSLLDIEDFKEFSLPYLREIYNEIRKRYPSVPLFVFPRDSCSLYPLCLVELKKIGYDVIGVDSKNNIEEVNKILRDGNEIDAQEIINDGKHLVKFKKDTIIQGNLDPKLFILEENEAEILINTNLSDLSTKSKELYNRKIILLNELDRIKEIYNKNNSYIFNIGEGLSGKENPQLIKWFISQINV